jgi:hypothetical protein
MLARITIEMTDAVTRICAEGIKASNPEITDEELIQEIRRLINRE